MKRQFGFSLIELAIALLIAGLMMGAGLSLLTIKRDQAQLEATRSHQQAIKQALINYLAKYHRLPCPSDPATNTPLSANPGKEDRNAAATTPPCNRYIGTIPFVDLGIEREIAQDGWYNYMTYMVTPNPIATSLPAATPTFTTSWLYSFAYGATQTNSITPTGSQAFWPTVSTGGIKITDGTNTLADPATATGAVIVVISYGKNGLGAFNQAGSQNDYATAGPDEKKNADQTQLISGSPPTLTTVRKGLSTTFDDVVMPINAGDFTASGLTGVQAAMVQANSIVLGSIISNRKNCSPCQYDLPASIAFPPSITDFGITYSRTLNILYVTSTGTGPAYTLTAGDGSSRVVSISELNGTIAQSAGFL